MKIDITCPLGHKCEKAVVGDKVERCAWYIQMRGTDYAGQEKDEWNCAIAWQPILQVEVAQTNRGISASVQSMRNEQTKRQDTAIKLLKSTDNVKAIQSV